MCGRASLPNDVSELKQDLRIEWDKLGDYRPRWNAAPTSDLPVVTSSPRRSPSCCETYYKETNSRSWPGGGVR